jgi:hypothetical protein
MPVGMETSRSWTPNDQTTAVPSLSLLGLRRPRSSYLEPLTCTISPVIANIMQQALKQPQKKRGALEHVPRFKDGLVVRDNEIILDFASRGQARLRNPTLFLHNTKPVTIKALAHWLSNPQVSMLSDAEFRRMLLFDLTQKHNDYCGCGRVEYRMSGTLCPSTYCSGHDPTTAISLIYFAEEFQMTRLRHEITRGLQISCGIDQFVEQHLGLSQFAHCITFQRCVADERNFKTTTQYLRLTITEKAVEQGVTELTGGSMKSLG